MKLKVITFLIVTLFLVIGIVIGSQLYKGQLKAKDNKIESLQQEQSELKNTNQRLSELVKRQSKTVISDEEKQIREKAELFVKSMFEM
ncbi:hypothetical protein O0H47_12045, partial [Staphylococcus pseudintermedius]|nr:hypothetical protein [Staphylococcus pseudintermedius]MDE9927178.1 hypothetical protein [Staphylococcus pseudintermedius]MDE9931729.1 hypothetical protein [Staphylococcus pseudintermedius]MDE9936410.1 hypothetical protein [Staphylococcus pseudintermedius]